MFLLLGFALSLTASAAITDTTDAPEMTVEEVQATYTDLFTAEVRPLTETVYTVARSVVEPPPSHPLSGLVREHGRIPGYLLTHWTGVPDSLLAAVPGDSAAVAAAFQGLLRKDSTFNALFLPVVDRYLNMHGGDLIGFEPPPPASIPYDDFLDIAVRFFYPDAIRPDGTIQSHVCVAINGVRELSGPRRPYAEALAYVAILNAFFSASPENPSELEQNWRETNRLMNSIALGQDPETRLLRAQGLMWGQMAQSDELHRVLQSEYEGSRDVLPLVLFEDLGLVDSLELVDEE
jgi:hypothetical protein